ncbi:MULTISPECIES: sulfatase/phosphatase domain-containing protein [unclassified Bradyrhizobium]|uniref:sulfatase family protein n=1 Tax=unclassified Bradyrhizobium TaxID=2631580 RepID=UPI00339521D8
MLKDKGYLDNCVLIFMSNHGDNLGEHGLSQKWSMYELVTRIPLLFWSLTLFSDGRRIREKCQLFDLAPTILDLAGAEHPKPFQARSLLPALKGGEWAGRDFVFTEQAGDVAMTGARLITMVRDDRWKVMFIHDAEDGSISRATRLSSAISGACPSTKARSAGSRIPSSTGGRTACSRPWT